MFYNHLVFIYEKVSLKYQRKNLFLIKFFKKWIPLDLPRQQRMAVSDKKIIMMNLSFFFSTFI